jgi:hypothetical protein
VDGAGVLHLREVVERELQWRRNRMKRHPRQRQTVVVPVGKQRLGGWAQPGLFLLPLADPDQPKGLPRLENPMA